MHARLDPGLAEPARAKPADGAGVVIAQAGVAVLVELGRAWPGAIRRSALAHASSTCGVSADMASAVTSIKVVSGTVNPGGHRHINGARCGSVWPCVDDLRGVIACRLVEPAVALSARPTQAEPSEAGRSRAHQRRRQRRSRPCAAMPSSLFSAAVPRSGLVETLA